METFLNKIVEAVGNLAKADMTWEMPLSAQNLNVELDTIAWHVAAIPRTAALITDCEQAVQSLFQLRERYLAPVLHYIDVLPYPFAKKYGSLDPERLLAADIGVCRVCAEIAAIALDAIVDGAPFPRTESCLQLLEWHVVACRAARQPERALSTLAQFKRTGAFSDVVRRLNLMCLLDQGEVGRAESDLTKDEAAVSEVYRLEDRTQWLSSQHLVDETLFTEPVCPGRFSVSWPNGRTEDFEHVLPSMRLALTRPTSLSLRRGEILIGEDQQILRPARLHYPLGYPDQFPDLRARGEAAVRLANVSFKQDVSEPVVVLENFDAVFKRNYYHWVVLILARISYLRDAGLFRRRRLVVPDGLSAWMSDSCEAIGLKAEDLLSAPKDVELRFTDALLVSTVEWASPTLLRSLSGAMFRSDETDVQGEPQHLFISRLTQARRPLINELEILTIARDLGFTVVQPETLSFTEQARLFHSAASVCGPEGAAFANTIFCRPRTRVLTILSENDLFPTYNDLCVAMDLSHQKLTGRAERDADGVNYIWAPYRVEPTLAERDLLWARDGGGLSG